MSVSVDAVIAKEMKQKEFRERYNKDPKVVAKRKLYNKMRQAQSKIGRQVISGELSMEEGEKLLAELETEYNDEIKELNGSITQAPMYTNVEASTSARPKVPKKKKVLKDS